MPAATDVSLLSKIDDAVLELESFLVSQMQMKLEVIIVCKERLNTRTAIHIVYIH